MRRDDSIFLIENQRTAQNIFKMTKTRTAMFLVVLTLSCALIFSISDALPTPETATSEDPETKLGNNSRLVITHVVKTIEFEVGVVDDDGISDENDTDSNASEFFETNIELLNIDLLKEVVEQAEENDEATKEPSSSQIVNEEKTEGAEGQEQMEKESPGKIEKLTS